MSEKIEINLSVELVKAIEEHRGSFSASEFIEQGMKWAMERPKRARAWSGCAASERGETLEGFNVDIRRDERRLEYRNNSVLLIT